MSAARRRRLSPFLRLALLLLLFLSAAVVWSFNTVPKSNMGSEPADVLLVLGTPAELDGSVTPSQRWRADEAIREWRAGRAPRILFSGGPAANPFVEAEVMARYAAERGVPETALFRERTSRTTLENLRNSEPILRLHGWRRVEVISSAEHLPRAAVLLAHSGLAWRVHPAPTPGRSRVEIAGAYAEEAVGTAALRLFGTRVEPVLHAFARVQHKVQWCLRWVAYKIEG